MKEKNVFQLHFRLAQLRARLYQAMEEGNAADVEAISARIDALQLEHWKKEKQRQLG